MLFPIIMCVLITQVYSIGKNVLMLYQFSNIFFTYMLDYGCAAAMRW